MKRLLSPSFQTRPYSACEIVRIVDRWQQYQYIKHGARPVDMYVDIENENLVMLFVKSETKELFEKWRRYELK